ncbi:MAG: thiamine phosphate synthase [Gemmatimonadaceae bacterium]
MQLEALRLLAITDNLRDGIEGLSGRARACCRGGVTMIQLRLPDEDARTVAAAARALVASVRVPVVVHGRLDIAVATGAAGVHLGVHDVAVGDARRICGADFLIGRSARTSEDLVRAGGADYIALGPTFPTDQRRPGIALGFSQFERLARTASAPVVAVGGISSTTAPDAIRAGARGVALISGLFGSPDPESAARAVRAAIGT